MKRNIFIYLAFIGLFGGLSGCEKSGTKVVMLEDVIEPSLITTPEMTLTRTNGTNTLVFVGTPVDPGFIASATYFLEACPKGDKFANSIVLYSGVQDTSIKITVSDLNGMILKKFPADVVSSVDFRIRAVLIVDAGTGAPGTSTDPFEYVSTTITKDVLPYGLQRLDLLNSGVTQKIESALGDGKYFGYVKLDASKPFTLKDPDTNIEYGAASAGVLKVGGTAITSNGSGWYRMNADIKTLTYSLEDYMIGLVGSATPNGWNSPDQKMDYDSKTGTWNITITLIDGDIKFRKNDGWAWNLGGTTDKLEHNGANITVTAGNYTIKLTITNDTQGSEAGTFTMVKN